MVVVDLASPPSLGMFCPQVLDEREERDAIAREEKAAASAAAAVAAAAAAARVSGDAGAGSEREGGGGGREGGGGGPRGASTTPGGRRSRGTRAKSGRPLAKASGDGIEDARDFDRF